MNKGGEGLPQLATRGDAAHSNVDVVFSDSAQLAASCADAGAERSQSCVDLSSLDALLDRAFQGASICEAEPRETAVSPFPEAGVSQSSNISLGYLFGHRADTL